MKGFQFTESFVRCLSELCVKGFQTSVYVKKNKKKKVKKFEFFGYLTQKIHMCVIVQ